MQRPVIGNIELLWPFELHLVTEVSLKSIEEK
jgi:hypothetical protein